MDAQTIFAILVGSALACFSLVMVGYSFLRNREPQRELASTAKLPDQNGVGIDSLFDSIDTLDLEYQLENVPEEDYLQQLHSYRQQIAVLIKEQLENGDAPPELLLEREVLRARAGGMKVWRSCPQCDAPLTLNAASKPDGATCPHCSASLSSVTLGEEQSESPSTSSRQMTEL